MKEDKIKWLDISDLNIKAIVEKSASLMNDGRNLLAYVEREKNLLAQEDVDLFSQRAVAMIQQADESKWEMAKLCMKKYPELKEAEGITYSKDFTLVAGLTEERAIARRDKLKSEVTTSEAPFNKVLTDEVMRIVEMNKEDFSLSTIQDKLVDELACGNKKLKKALVNAFIEAYKSDYPDRSTVGMHETASQFLDDMVEKKFGKSKDRAEA